MREGKEPLRTFGDLKQFFASRDEGDASPPTGDVDATAAGAKHQASRASTAKPSDALKPSDAIKPSDQMPPADDATPSQDVARSEPHAEGGDAG
jgi:hypothetical protein